MQLVISCFWVSASHHGGPVLSPKEMRILADLDIEIWFDYYDEIVPNFYKDFPVDLAFDVKYDNDNFNTEPFRRS